MKALIYRALYLTVILAAVPTLGQPSRAQSVFEKPRLLVLPWLVIDRTTNQECTRGEPTLTLGEEARSLAASGQAGLDANAPQRVDGDDPAQGMGTSLAATGAEPGVSAGLRLLGLYPTGELLQYDRANLQKLAESVRAEYVWLGVTVVPVTQHVGTVRPDDCCREALGVERAEVLARSSVLLVRASDGAIVWQRDARRLERNVPHLAHPTSPLFSRGHQVTAILPEDRRQIAVRDTVLALGNAFRREYREALR